MVVQKRTEGEIIIEEFLKEDDIKFKPEVKIKNLKGDTIPYRKADFYLPQFKTYIEYLGRWNIEHNRKKYNEKKRVYKNNNIPCVYIYPDNLGILNFVLKWRLKQELKNYNLKWELFKLNFRIFQEKYLLELIILGVLIYFVNNLYVRILLGLFFLHKLYESIKHTFLD